MTAIGGTTKKRKPTQPQYVVQLASHLNEFAKLDILKQYWCVVPEDWIAAQEEPFPDEPYVAKQMGE